MQITVSPDHAIWVVVPEFPPPGWARDEARERARVREITDPQRRGDFEDLLEAVERSERTPAMARLLYVGDGSQPPFVVDLRLIVATDDCTKEGRHHAQKTLLNQVLPTGGPQRLRPNPDTAGFWAHDGNPAASTMAAPGLAVILRKAGLPTVPVDLLMLAWGAPTPQIAEKIGDIVDLSDQVGPAARN